MNYISNNIIRQVLFLAIIVILGLILFFQLNTFLPAFLGAYTLYVLMRKYMFLLENRYRWKKTWCAAVLMSLSFLIILVPVFTLVNMLTKKISSSLQNTSSLLERIKLFINNIEQRSGINILTAENLNKLAEWGAQSVPQILGATLTTIISIVVMYFILFFMLTEGRKMEAKFYEWVPLKDENVLILRGDMNRLVLSNAIGIPLIALAQGVVGLIGYIIIGVPEPLFWFVITCIAGMLPVVGAALAYIPLVIFTYVGGEPVRAVILLVFGLGIIGTVDNVFRFWLQKKLGNVHPTITVFGVLVGVSLFGFIGLIFGPILISLFILLLKVYATEFGRQRGTRLEPEFKPGAERD